MLIDQQRQNQQQYQDVMKMMAEQQQRQEQQLQNFQMLFLQQQQQESNVNEFTWKSNAQIFIRAGKGKTKVENQIVNLRPFQPAP